MLDGLVTQAKHTSVVAELFQTPACTVKTISTKVRGKSNGAMDVMVSETCLTVLVYNAIVKVQRA